jgi:hypothetical protein
VRHAARNVSRGAYALTVLAPITRGRESALARLLDELPSGAASPLARVPGTHFARWVVIDTVVFEGGGQHRDRLQNAQLLFTSNFDGPLDPYIEGLRVGLAADADAIWGQCDGYPEGPERFADYLRSHQVDTALFFAAYGQFTVEEVKANLLLRTRLIEFAMEGQATGAARLQSAFLASFPT